MKYTLPFLCLILVSCGTLGSVQNAADRIADVAEGVTPIVEKGKEIADDIRNAETPRDWAGILEKIAYGVGAAAALAGGEAYRRKRKAAKA